MTINEERLLNNFLSYLRIDSESGNELEMAKRLVDDLTALGFLVEQQPVPSELSNGFNVYAKLEGQLNDSVLLSCHMDTVTPGNGIEPIVEDGVVRSKGDTILGADDKSGIAAIIEAIQSIQEKKLPHKTIEIAFTVFEEGGLHGSRAFKLDQVSSDKALVLDSGGPIGTIITQAPGQQTLQVTIQGKPAHAGLAPEEGINALTVAAAAINTMNLGRIDFETTANIGTVNGGSATNIVMPEVILKAEARSLNSDKLTSQVEHMINRFEDAAYKHGAKLLIDSEREYDAYQIAEDDPLVQSIAKAFESVSTQPQTKSTGGGSDANIFNEKGLKTVNVSTGMSKVHTTDEFITIDDLNQVTRFVGAFLTAQ
ncbi:M20/M25/M40 family metallo-hydrolase [Paraferrimonas haliotis]|uniref:Peptidase M20 n=1 Tax=Paraferrimonas haliotis TaxID=2013866 RepID=A0AA37WZC8_9GAMM|nr:M20/M25/M40 family metallo-hydrolase [Paraferrimonas haliotis]GLS84770.1 peptidase M20 [Paraferrimonas haliotis]